MYKNALKPIIDIFIAIVLFLVISPVFIFITLFLFFVNEGKPFFFQQRPGKNSRIFTIIKFKTMNDKKNFHGALLPDKDRLTIIGSLIRRTSLDEIPQLLNVIVGDMSFVGPRPLLPEYLSLYSHDQNKRHDIRPGITGWAQINGRNAISWSKKLKLDQWYVENQSFYLDIKILLLTIKKVIKKENISSDTHVTIEKFNGKN